MDAGELNSSRVKSARKQGFRPVLNSMGMPWMPIRKFLRLKRSKRGVQRISSPQLRLPLALAVMLLLIGCRQIWNAGEGYRPGGGRRL